MPCDSIEIASAELRAREEAARKLDEDIAAGRIIPTVGLLGELVVPDFANSEAYAAGWAEACVLDWIVCHGSADARGALAQAGVTQASGLIRSHHGG